MMQDFMNMVAFTLLAKVMVNDIPHLAMGDPGRVLYGVGSNPEVHAALRRYALGHGLETSSVDTVLRKALSLPISEYRDRRRAGTYWPGSTVPPSVISVSPEVAAEIEKIKARRDIPGERYAGKLTSPSAIMYIMRQAEGLKPAAGIASTLRSSLSDEIRAYQDYQESASAVREAGDTQTAELLEHIAEEEFHHMDELRKRLIQLEGTV